MKLELNKVYKDGKGEQWKVICITIVGAAIVINQQQNRTRELSINGLFLIGKECFQDLVELVGDDFKNKVKKYQVIFKSIYHDEYRISSRKYRDDSEFYGDFLRCTSEIKEFYLPSEEEFEE